MPYPDEPIRQNPSESRDLPSSDPAQLSPPQGVKKGVGTLALNPEMYPGVAKNRTAKNGSPALARTASRPLSDMSDAEVMLLAGAGDDSAVEYLVGKVRRPIV